MGGTSARGGKSVESSGDGFAFDLDVPVHPVRISENEMIAELKRFGATRGGRAFEVRAFARWRVLGAEC